MKISKEITCYFKSIINARPQKIRVSANSRQELDKLIKDLRTKFIVK